MIVNANFKFIETCCLRIKLTKLETRLLLLLSDNEFHTYEEISNYLYDYTSIYCINNVHTVVRRLKLKIKLQLESKINSGLVLKDKILIDR